MQVLCKGNEIAFFLFIFLIRLVCAVIFRRLAVRHKALFRLGSWSCMPGLSHGVYVCVCVNRDVRAKPVIVLGPTACVPSCVERPLSGDGRIGSRGTMPHCPGTLASCGRLRPRPTAVSPNATTAAPFKCPIIPLTEHTFWKHTIKLFCNYISKTEGFCKI